MVTVTYWMAGWDLIAPSAKVRQFVIGCSMPSLSDTRSKQKFHRAVTVVHKFLQRTGIEYVLASNSAQVMADQALTAKCSSTKYVHLNTISVFHI